MNIILYFTLFFTQESFVVNSFQANENKVFALLYTIYFHVCYIKTQSHQVMMETVSRR